MQHAALRRGCRTGAKTRGYHKTGGSRQASRHRVVVRRLNQDKGFVVKTRDVLGLSWDFTKCAQCVRTWRHR